MSWFERHLNWSLFFAISLLPFVISMIVVAIFFVLMGPTIATIVAGGKPTMESVISTMLPLFLVSLVLGLAFFVWDIIAIIWYLGKKARSKWFLMLVFGPAIVQVILQFLGAKAAGEVIGGLGALVGIIILYCLKNLSMDYGVDLAGGEETTHWSDTPTYGAVDDRQYKELDYTPDKNVMDMVGSGGVKDVGDVSAAGVAGEEAPVPEKVIDRSVSTERLKIPILLDDTGAVIRCFYHPGADAVNLCSRCKQYVCSECNYVTGTHPICRNCWEKRTEVPIAPPAQKRVSPPSVKPKKQEVVETAEPAQQKDLEPMKPEKQEAVETAKPAQQKDLEMKPEKQKIAAPGKAEKAEAKKLEWLPEFMALYEQAAPIINVVVRKSADGMPASPLDLMEGLKLRPMLERAKKLSKPKDKELREAKNEFEQVLSSCVKIADAAANFVSGGGQALLGGPDFTRIVHGIETANGLMEKLSQRLASFPHPQE
jgi:hypothetical protein